MVYKITAKRMSNEDIISVDLEQELLVCISRAQHKNGITMEELCLHLKINCDIKILAKVEQEVNDLLTLRVAENILIKTGQRYCLNPTRCEDLCDRVPRYMSGSSRIARLCTAAAKNSSTIRDFAIIIAAVSFTIAVGVVTILMGQKLTAAPPTESEIAWYQSLASKFRKKH